MTALKRTPLYDVQAKLSARFVDFAGWQMPVQFEGVMAEHHAVRSKVGLFDVSHMGEFEVKGPEAQAALNWAFTNNISNLVVGRALYTVMCGAQGGIVDDLIVYRDTSEIFFIVVNASRIEDDFSHLQYVLSGFDCTIENHSDNYALLALQGPRCFDVLSRLSGKDHSHLKPFDFVFTSLGDVDNVRLAVTGYTGEKGVELYLRPEDAPKLWTALFEAGRDAGIVPCGLGARDTLRLEMCYALYGQDISLEAHPLEAGLGWVVKWNKGDFMGRAALVGFKETGPLRKLMGFKMLGRGIPRADHALYYDDVPIGKVTSGTHSPILGYPIGLGYIHKDYARIGERFDVIIRDKRVQAEVVKTPFYKRGT
jgi:aminomethyltransferase